MKTTPKFDHLLLVQRHPLEVARFVALVKREMAAGGGLQRLHIEHEADNSCCRREPWAATLLFLLADPAPAASIDDGMPAKPGGHRPRSRR